ncbi:Corrinoid adenosyltransferase [subsurface metagenome]
MKRGLVQIYTGKGKGKTTAAIGQAIRARGRGLRILFVQFLKGKEGSGEIPLLEDVGIKVICKGEKDRWFFPDRLKEEEKKKIRLEWTHFLDEISRQVIEEKYDLVILDEINVVLYYELIDKNRLIDFIRKKPAWLEIILTGRHASPELIELAHLVSEIKSIKHPFDAGMKARRGIEY